MESSFSKVTDRRSQFDHIPSANAKPGLDLITSWHWEIVKAISKWERLLCIILNRIRLSSPQKVDLGFSGFLWDCLSFSGVVYLGLIAFHIVNIISLTSVGRTFEDLEKKIQIKRFQHFRFSFWASAKEWEQWKI